MKIFKGFTSLALMALTPGMFASVEAAPGKQANAQPMQLATIQSDKQDPSTLHASGCCCAACQQSRTTIDRSTV